jgi:hypothetical protein
MQGVAAKGSNCSNCLLLRRESASARNSLLRECVQSAVPARHTVGSRHDEMGERGRLNVEPRPELAALCRKHRRLLGTELGEKLVVGRELALPARAV